MAIHVNRFRAQVFRSQADAGPAFDMTPDGKILPPRASGGIPVTAKVGAVAVLVAVTAGAIGIAALALWLAMTIVPIALVAGAVAYGAFRLQRWRGAGSFGSGVGSVRPWDRS